MTTSPPGSPNSKIDFPTEFSGLIQTVNSIRSFKSIDLSPTIKCSRFILEGSSEKGQIFIKQLHGKRVFNFHSYCKQEQLAYIISHRLKFGVVPPTIALEGYKNSVPLISKIARERFLNSNDKSYKGIVIQEGIPLAPIQYHMRPQPLKDFPVDAVHLTNAVLFNIVTGRTDALPRNSVIDRSHRIMEIDCERIGKGPKTSSWLFQHFADFKLDKEVIQDFLRKDVSIIDEIFNDLKSLLFDRFSLHDNLKHNIKSNFTKLQTFLHNNPEATVSDLAAVFYEEE